MDEDWGVAQCFFGHLHIRIVINFYLDRNHFFVGENLDVIMIPMHQADSLEKI